jgi:glucose/arabinose dehydrogenase
MAAVAGKGTGHRGRGLAALIAMLVLACQPVTQASPGPATSGPAASPGGTVASPIPPTLAPTGRAAFDAGRISITVEPFITVPGGPLAIAALPDGSGRLFVAAQDGRAWVVDDGAVLPAPLLDLRDRITSGGERGLLGVAVHPRFPDDPRVFVDYTDRNGDTVVSSFTLDSNDPNRVDPAREAVVLQVDQPFANHNGGAVVFGPDGFLYISLGDGGSGGDPMGNGQSLDTLLGKILRLDVDNRPPDLAYGIPEGNPFAEGDGRDEIWQYGLRNPWRLSFDRSTRDLWIGDVGQGEWEEIDHSAAGAGGLNFGWNVREGAHCFRASNCSMDGLTEPVAEYSHADGCTVIGGYVYRGSAFPALQGGYLFADYCSGRIFAISGATSELTSPSEVGRTTSGISAFGEDAAGELYLMNLDGTISRIVASAR